MRALWKLAAVVVIALAVMAGYIVLSPHMILKTTPDEQLLH